MEAYLIYTVHENADFEDGKAQAYLEFLFFFNVEFFYYVLASGIFKYQYFFGSKFQLADKDLNDLGS